MRLNVHTDYALRILMFLAAKQAQASVDEIATSYAISRNHLMKVSRKLTELGYVTTRRGRGGGLTLAQDPRSIIVGTVVRSIEPIGGFVECFDRINNQCPVTGVCGLQGAGPPKIRCPTDLKGRPCLASWKRLPIRAYQSEFTGALDVRR